MFILGNLFAAFAQILDIVFSISYFLILVRAIISWVNADPFNPIVQFLQNTTEPILKPIRRFLPSMTIDISPIIAVVIIIFLQKFLISTLYDIAFKLKV